MNLHVDDAQPTKQEVLQRGRSIAIGLLKMTDGELRDRGLTRPGLLWALRRLHQHSDPTQYGLAHETQ
jgi:hypothetical protein